MRDSEFRIGNGAINEAVREIVGLGQRPIAAELNTGTGKDADR
jgi:hypothetical protein